MKQRFLEKFVEAESGCWQWTAAKNKRGYGKLADGNRGWVLAHRFSYEMYVGKIAQGKEVCHKCDNPGCVNPSHLFIGTHSENMSDCKKKGRAVGHKRELNPNAKLTEEDVFEIRNSNLSKEELAKKFGVTVELVRKIIRKVLWR